MDTYQFPAILSAPAASEEDALKVIDNELGNTEIVGWAILDGPVTKVEEGA